MRVVAALLCPALIGSAGMCWATGSRNRWPLVAMLFAMTPVLVYSSTVAAPNGIEMCAGVALWAALLGLTRPALSRIDERFLLGAPLPSAVVLGLVRQLGPLWLVLIV